MRGGAEETKAADANRASAAWLVWDRRADGISGGTFLSCFGAIYGVRWARRYSVGSMCAMSLKACANFPCDS